VNAAESAPLRAAIVGLGAISFEHIEKLLLIEDAAIAGMCELDPLVGAAVSERFRIEPVFTELDRMLDETRPDVVHVLTPPATHLPIVLRALGAGAHVLVEKPMATSWDEYVEMRDAAARADRRLVENYNWRLARPVRRAEELYRAGVLGEAVHVEATFGGVMRGPVLSDSAGHFSHELPGGALHNFATHPVSLALAFVGAPTGLATAQLRLDPLAQSNDELRALLAGDTATALVSVTRHGEPPAFTVRITGTKGSLELDLYNDRLFLARPGGGASKVVNAVRRGMAELTGGAALVAKTVTAQLDHFEGLEFLIRRLYESIKTGGEPPITVTEMDAVNQVMSKLFAPAAQL
jgi:predicted dehydrogenase